MKEKDIKHLENIIAGRTWFIWNNFLWYLILFGRLERRFLGYQIFINSWTGQLVIIRLECSIEDGIVGWRLRVNWSCFRTDSVDGIGVVVAQAVHLRILIEVYAGVGHVGVRHAHWYYSEIYAVPFIVFIMGPFILEDSRSYACCCCCCCWAIMPFLFIS